jgi:hypothetical protein
MCNQQPLGTRFSTIRQLIIARDADQKRTDRLGRCDADPYLWRASRWPGAQARRKINRTTALMSDTWIHPSTRIPVGRYQEADPETGHPRGLVDRLGHSASGAIKERREHARGVLRQLSQRHDRVGEVSKSRSTC